MYKKNYIKISSKLSRYIKVFLLSIAAFLSLSVYSEESKVSPGELNTYVNELESNPNPPSDQPHVPAELSVPSLESGFYAAKPVAPSGDVEVYSEASKETPVTAKKPILKPEDTMEIEPKKLTGFYLNINSGASSAFHSGETKFNARGMGTVGVGYDINELLRTDINVQYRGVSVKGDSGIQDIKDASNVSFMWNGYFNLSDRGDRFVPYLTAGLGCGLNKLKTFSNDVSTTTGKWTGTFVWNAGLGGVIRLGDRWGVDLFYRYVDLGSVIGKVAIDDESTGVHLKDVQAHEFGLGIILRL